MREGFFGVGTMVASVQTPTLAHSFKDRASSVVVNENRNRTIESDNHDRNAITAIRKLVMDCCTQNGGGHGGSAIDMAPLALVLWKYTMRYNAKNPNWFDRDRFVLSNGHAAILLYSMLYLTGSPDFSLDELKGYASAKLDGYTTLCHGHPEREIDGIEVTTGPLGQGIANAVGLAIASKNLAARYNKQEFPIVSSRIFCTTGDGCIQEGVALEALSIAGHLKLDNLVLLYDNNGVTCDGPLDWILSEDVNKKVEAMGWNVLNVLDGDSDIQAIVEALNEAAETKGKPTFINIRTTIGYHTSKAGTAAAHHGSFNSDDYKSAGQDGQASYYIRPEVVNDLRNAGEKGVKLEHDWNNMVAAYKEKYPKDWEHLISRISGKFEYQDLLSSIKFDMKPQASRDFNGIVFKKLFQSIENIFAGGADLWTSNKMGTYDSQIFGPDNFSGRIARYGIREHAMASISNGIAAYNPPGTFIPVTATFFMFYLYASAGVRMGALSHLRVIHVATHDSFAEGQNGPTHQPVELDSLYRAMPNIQYIRPADGEEVVAAWNLALGACDKPTIISLGRDAPLTPIPNTDRNKALRGGYTIVECVDAKVTLISSGTELQFAAEASKLLNKRGISTRVVSMPSIGIFESQPSDYQDKIVGTSQHIISIEPYIPTVWARFCTGSIGMSSFGYSASGYSNVVRFGFTAEQIADRVASHISKPFMRKWKLIE